MSENKKLFAPEHFDFPKQVKFLDLGDTQGREVWHGGIIIDDCIICGCCGTVIPLEEIFADWEEYGKEEYPNVETPIEIYDYWVPLSEEIIGE